MQVVSCQLSVISQKVDRVMDAGMLDQPAYILARSDPRAYATQHATCDILNGDVNGDGVLDADDDALFLALLSSGNSADYVVYTWDAENRLTKVEPGGTPQNGQCKAEYKYDWQGRRIEKQVWTYSGGWTQTEHWKFMYADWLLLLELDGLDDDSVKRQYTWGLDLSGVASGAPAGRLTGGGLPAVLTAAGGIGGLLAMHDEGASASYVYYADVQGNIGQVVDLAAATASASMLAKYEYDGYGNRSVIASTYAQPFGFSTKHYDAESGFAYFGYRHYCPVLGRWISRDRLGEDGGVALYSHALNAPVVYVDALGLIPIGGYPLYMPPPPPPPPPGGGGSAKPPPPIPPPDARALACGPEPTCSSEPIDSGITSCLDAMWCRADKCVWSCCVQFSGFMYGWCYTGCAAISDMELLLCLPVGALTGAME